MKARGIVGAVVAIALSGCVLEVGGDLDDPCFEVAEEAAELQVRFEAMETTWEKGDNPADSPPNILGVYGLLILDNQECFTDEAIEEARDYVDWMNSLGG